MKKNYLSCCRLGGHRPLNSFLLLLLMTSLLQATAGFSQQRNIDLETVAISPSGPVVNGNSLPLSFKWTIHGPDAWQHGDSIFYALYGIRSTGEMDVFYTGILINHYQDMDSGKTAQYADPYVINFDYADLTDPLILDFCVTLYSEVTRPNGELWGLDYTDPDTANNTSCMSVTVYPTSTAIDRQATTDAAGFSFFPNPAEDQLNIQIHKAAGPATLSLCDLRGVVLWTGTCPKSQAILHLDVSTYPAGLYLLRLETVGGISIKKLLIR